MAMVFAPNTQSDQEDNPEEHLHLRNLGAKLRSHRKAAGLTLTELAARVDLDKGYLSRIENGKKVPPLATLSRLANALDIEAGSLIGYSVSTPGTWRGVSVVRHDEQRPTVMGGTTFGYDYFALSKAKPNHALQPFLFSFPEQIDKYVFFQHDGEELLYVLSGKIEWQVGSQKYVLKAGDTIHFDSQIPHRGRSLSGQATALVVMFSPAGFDENLA
ncbi:helix-turn-helix domain-containing protein [Allopusillimonas ginsengisoli]|uniref:helix-turn-helix domain-containing protein n=1 Tax=Allopusillimonas ginsengisoli TaxID=453575 RepID=UPI00102092D9|nr:XRE family transcriptional regulator [Allopusillimonas ginsengisoli]TEA74135.1 XRE family transcriptional regulator [Allopusillimonas ginsengisoli]